MKDLQKERKKAMEDSSIVDLFLQRNEDALTETDKKYGKKLLSLSCSITEDERDAEECRNSTYYKAWNSIPPHEPRQYLFPFLSRIIRHLSLNVCKSRRTESRSAVFVDLSDELEACIPSPDDTESKLDDMAIKAAIDGFLSSLPERNRLVFMRRYYYCDSVKKIADGVGISEDSVKVILHRCRQKLLSYLQKEGIEL